MKRTDLLGRVQEYAQANHLEVGEQLGYGLHGIVFAADYQHKAGRCAVKVHTTEEGYRRERDVYLHLQKLGVNRVRACHVPELLAFDDRLWIVGMTIVDRPFALDFAGAYLDHPPEFSDEVIADWRAEKAELYEGKWAEAQAVLGSFELLGVYILDVNPGNLCLDD